MIKSITLVVQDIGSKTQDSHKMMAANEGLWVPPRDFFP